MLAGDTLPLAALFVVMAVLYSSVGHAGASGYLAAMAAFSLPPSDMRVTALALNVLVSVIGTVRYIRAGQFHWRSFYPFILLSIPAAFLGGSVPLPPMIYRPTVGIILLFAAAQLARSAHQAGDRDARRGDVTVPIMPALGIGAVIGLLSGLTGTGGGIFLSPVLLFAGWAPTRRTSGISAAFILVNSLAGLAGTSINLTMLPTGLPVWIGAALVGGLIGTQLGTRWASVAVLRYFLAAVLVIAGLKLILT